MRIYYSYQPNCITSFLPIHSSRVWIYVTNRRRKLPGCHNKHGPGVIDVSAPGENCNIPIHLGNYHFWRSAVGPKLATRPPALAGPRQSYFKTTQDLMNRFEDWTCVCRRRGTPFCEFACSAVPKEPGWKCAPSDDQSSWPSCVYVVYENYTTPCSRREKHTPERERAEALLFLVYLA